MLPSTHLNELDTTCFHFIANIKLDILKSYLDMLYDKATHCFAKIKKIKLEKIEIFVSQIKTLFVL